MKRKTIFLWAAVLLCGALPMRASAQTVNVPLLCVEKTNGEVVKVEITDSSPNMLYGARYNEDEGKVVLYLIIRRNDVADITVDLKDIKRAYSSFEEVDAVRYLKADGIAPTADVLKHGSWRDALTNPTSVK